MVKKRILVVDDEPDFLDVIKSRLESSNYDVITASSGKEALAKVKNAKPDVALLDIMMPGMDGLQVLKTIRKLNKNLPVFIITAFSSEERFKLANKFNASGFIIKTGNLKKEIKNINSILGIADRYRHRKT